MERKIKVYCYYNDGEQELTDEQYTAQLGDANAVWKCPECGRDANWMGIDLQCPNCQEWFSDEEEVCPHCNTCYCCSGNGAPELEGGQCPICGVFAKVK